VKYRIAFAATAVLALAGCKHAYNFDPPAEEDRVAEAADRITPQLFDTISWADAESRVLEGNGVFAAKCRRCHGPRGFGGTGYALSRGLKVPSLVNADWRWADSLSAVRRTVFTGHAGGMPTWGVGRITAREIDAVANYILFGLRHDTVAQDKGD
jgi:mono/diheme cytochrome c family protein